MIISKAGVASIVGLSLLFTIMTNSQQGTHKDYGSSKKAFSIGAQLSKLKHNIPIASMAKMPKASKALQKSKYPHVRNAAIQWAKYMFSSEYLPSDSFMRSNLVLFRACKDTGGADAAFLAYSVNGKQCMIVQTVGLMCLFMQDDSLPSKLASEDAEQQLKASMAELLLPARQKKIPSMTLIKKETLSEMRAGKWVTIVFYYAGNEACFYLEKDMFKEGPQAAHIPMEHEWFDYIESLNY